MNTVSIILPADPYLSTAFVFVSVAVFVRIVRWLLDILP